MTQPDAPILELHDVSRSFFGVPVLKRVSLSLPRGRVLGLVGENGAGKSTLMNIVGGVLPPDSGRVLFDGLPYAPAGSREAARAGVSFIHQELNLFPNLTVAENLHLPTFPLRRVGPLPLPLVDRPRMRAAAATLLAQVYLNCSPDTPVEALSPGERQLVEVAKAVGADAKLILFDEPTTSLTARESERLFDIIARLRAHGVSMIYISHRLEDVRRLCDQVAVLRDGQVVGAGPAAEFGVERMIALMVGRDIQQLYPQRAARAAGAAAAGLPALEVSGLSRAGVLHDISMTLRRGEIVGMSGLMGAGRTELVRTLFGLDPFDRGTIQLNGVPLDPSPRRCVRRGMALLTEDRRLEGLLMDASVSDNVALAALPLLARTPLRWVDAGLLRRRTAEAAESVRLAGVATARQAARTLSGGNQQKVVLAKWLLREPTVFVLDEPTRGIDVGAKQEVYRIIAALAERGAAVLMVSSEIEELIGMCDRILVMSRGRLRGEFARHEFDRERIMARAFDAGGATA